MSRIPKGRTRHEEGKTAALLQTLNQGRDAQDFLLGYSQFLLLFE